MVKYCVGCMNSSVSNSSSKKQAAAELALWTRPLDLPSGPALWTCPLDLHSRPALWRCPWKMPAEAAPVEEPADSLKFVGEVLRQTPFGRARRRRPFEFYFQSRPLNSVAEVVNSFESSRSPAHVKEVLSNPCHVRSRYYFFIILFLSLII